MLLLNLNKKIKMHHFCKINWTTEAIMSFSFLLKFNDCVLFKDFI